MMFLSQDLVKQTSNPKAARDGGDAQDGEDDSPQPRRRQKLEQICEAGKWENPDRTHHDGKEATIEQTMITTGNRREYNADIAFVLIFMCRILTRRKLFALTVCQKMA